MGCCIARDGVLWTSPVAGAVAGERSLTASYSIRLPCNASGYESESSAKGSTDIMARFRGASGIGSAVRLTLCTLLNRLTWAPSSRDAGVALVSEALSSVFEVTGLARVD